jgi:hypothetical protein
MTGAVGHVSVIKGDFVSVALGVAQQHQDWHVQMMVHNGDDYIVVLYSLPDSALVNDDLSRERSRDDTQT